MLVVGLLLALNVTSQQPATIQPPEAAPIVVTAESIADYRARLAACLSRHCPTNEDADATLALAEALFLEGEYNEGRLTVRASLRRNGHAAAAFPEAVSDLYRAHARFSRHLGYDDQALDSTRSILESLRRGIPHEDYRHFRARLELSDAYMRVGKLAEARDQLAALARSARRTGDEDVAILAELRGLLYENMANRHGGAQERLAAIAHLTDPAQRQRAIGARIMLSRIYRDEGRIAEAGALIAGLNLSDGGSRRLLQEPAYQLAVQQVAEAGSDINGSVESGPVNEGPRGVMTAAIREVPGRLSDTFERTWVDVGFWVLPDGHVSGVEIVRHRSGTSWANPLLRAIAGRLYSSAPQATYRLERYTYTAGFERQTGSWLPQRSMTARAEYFDLSENAVPPGPPPAPPAPPPPGSTPSNPSPVR